MPPICFTRVLSTALPTSQAYVRVNDGMAVFATVTSAPTQSRADADADAVFGSTATVVYVAVLSKVVHVPGVPVIARE